VPSVSKRSLIPLPEIIALSASTPLGRCVKIVETVASSVTSTKQFVRRGDSIAETRDGSGNLLAQYFHNGQTISGTSYYYTKDHLGSIREMTDSSGTIQAQYNYEAYGRKTKLQGSLDSDFQFAAYYFHAPSGLSLTLNRNYSASLGRWMSRDPIGEIPGDKTQRDVFWALANNPEMKTALPNPSLMTLASFWGGSAAMPALFGSRYRHQSYNQLYGYMENDPLGGTDPEGLFVIGFMFCTTAWVLCEHYCDLSWGDPSGKCPHHPYQREACGDLCLASYVTCLAVAWI
jgi:RHS repeat-associated protein